MTVDNIEQHDIAQVGKEFFFYFVTNILGYDKVNEDNLVWCLKWQEYVEEWERARKGGIETQFNSLWLEPRETFKSTILTISGLIWIIVRNNNVSIVLGSKIADNAQKFLREIKQHFEKNDVFRKLYGDYVGKEVWSQTQIIVSKRMNIGIKEPTIQAVGANTALTSVHFDVGVFDDLVDPKDRTSAAERLSTKNFNSDLADVIKRNGFKQYVGTRWHPSDLYHDLINTIIPQSKSNPHSRWLKDIRSCYRADGSPRFKVLPLSFLEQKKIDKGSVVFAANYENKPLSGETQLFDEDNLCYFDMNEIDITQGEVVGYCDPAIGENKKNCYAPIISALVIREDDSGNMLKRPVLYVFDMDVKQRKPTIIKDTIANKHKEYNYYRFGMEANAMQSELADNTEERITALENINNLVIEHIVNKINKDVRIEALEIPVNSQNIKFRKDWRTAPNDYKEGVEQLIWYPIHDFKDAPDALEGLWSMCNKVPGILI